MVEGFTRIVGGVKLSGTNVDTPPFRGSMTWSTR